MFSIRLLKIPPKNSLKYLFVVSFSSFAINLNNELKGSFSQSFSQALKTITIKSSLSLKYGTISLVIKVVFPDPHFPFKQIELKIFNPCTKILSSSSLFITIRLPPS
jgi:hypothetical protein